MDIKQGSIWYDTENEEYVEVASIKAFVPHVNSHASGVCIAADQLRISVGPFDGYGPTPWGRRDCYIEQFEERYEPTDLSREEALEK